ncbi:MAG: YqaJ viral recombinase family protein [Proteobacteria bacterium]|nr:YqaJ viral recombinase family protein [Pseudomonadota bacterium]
MGTLPVGISGSRSAAILGMSKYTTQLAVWQQICEARRPGFNKERGYIFEPFDGDASTRFGHAFEGSVIELTEQSMDRGITDHEGEYNIIGDVPITCHIDGRFSPTHIFEGKSAYSRAYDKSWGEPGTDRIPATYQAQTQHNMMVTGAEECTVSVLVFPRSPQEWEDEGWKIWKAKQLLENNGDEFKYRLRHEKHGNIYPHNWATSLAQQGFFHQYHITAKPEVHKLLREAYNHFWANYVLTEQPPEISDYDDLKRLFPEPKGDLVVPEDVQNMLREYRDLGRELGTAGHLKKRQTVLKTNILKFAKDQTTVADDDAIERVNFLDDCGNKLGSFNGKMFRC